MNIEKWTIAEAKANFSKLIDRAESAGPQVVTRHGRTTVVVVAAGEWGRKKKRVGTLADFFAASPLRCSGLRISRVKAGTRKVSN